MGPSTTLVRLRIALADRPGALAAVAAAIARRGGNIEAVDVLAPSGDGTRVLDDVTVAFPGPAPIDELRADLAADGVATLHSHRSATHRDPVVLVLERAVTLRALVEAGRAAEADDLLAATVGELCAAPVVWVERPGAGPAHHLGALAAAQGGAVCAPAADLPAARADRMPGPGWLLAVPDPAGGRHAGVVLAARGGEPYTVTEIARIEALMGVLAPGAAPRGA